jgi:hypothetical protein
MRKIVFGLSALATLGWASSAHADGVELHGFGDVSLKNDYVTPRGLVVTTDGATIQVLNGLVLTTPGGVAFHAGTWVDLNPGYGDINTDSINEFDFFVGVSGEIAPKLEAGVEYSQFISGMNAYDDERNIEFSLKYKDGADGAPLSINPYVKFFWAVDGDSTVVFGKKGDTFDIEVGAAPSYTFENGSSITVPTWITVGPKSYWGSAESGGTPDGSFGVFSTGLKAATPLKFIKGGASASLYVQAQYYHLINDNLVAAKALLNGGDDNRDHVVLATGISFGF